MEEPNPKHPIRASLEEKRSPIQESLAREQGAFEATLDASLADLDLSKSEAGDSHRDLTKDLTKDFKTKPEEEEHPLTSDSDEDADRPLDTGVTFGRTYSTTDESF